jgi:hypothetical protein
MTGTPIQSTASVPTDAAARYAKQLASHLGRKIEAEPVGDGWLLHIAGGTCELLPRPDALVLSATAPDAETLATVEDVVGRHLVRFGARAELSVEWSSGTRNDAVPAEDSDPA